VVKSEKVAMPAKSPNPSGNGPLIMIAGGVVVLLVVLLLLLLSNTPAQPLQPTLAVQPTISVPRVSLVDAFQAYNQKTAVFLDVRDADSYASGHIPGALNIPLADLAARSGELSASKWIITYCT
jgi:hypothetical protein